MLIDLQFHSTYSDGVLSPTSLVQFLKKQGVRVAALTDHNTVAGLPEFFSACRRARIKALPAVEIYVRDGTRKMNILFYNFHYPHDSLTSFLDKIQQRRRRSLQRALDFWEKQGYQIDWEFVRAFPYYLPINRIARHLWRLNKKRVQLALREKSPHESEIISYFFKNRRQVYLDEEYVALYRLENLRKKIGGKIILAHPAKQRIKKDFLLKLVREKRLDGVELLSPHHSWDTICYYQHILRKQKNLIISGGSDFHGYSGDKLLQSPWQYFSIDSSLLKNIDKLIK